MTQNHLLSKRGKVVKAFFVVLVTVMIVAIIGIFSNNHLLQAKGSAITMGEAVSLKENALSLSFKKEIEKQQSIYEEEQLKKQEAAKAEEEKKAEEAKTLEKQKAAVAAEAKIINNEASPAKAAPAAAPAPVVPQGPKDVNTQLKSSSGLTSSILNNQASGTGLAGLGDAFMAAEQNYGVNAGFLFSLAVIESGWGNSGMAKQDNNLFGFGSKSFSSKEACIDYVAKFINDYYLSSNGQFYRGGSLADVNSVYCSENSNWKHQILSIWNEF